MAKFEPTLLGESLFGKTGGQNVSLTRNGSIIRNTTIPPLSPSLKQSKQRFKTANFGNSYKFLSGPQKTAWEATATNYTYIDSAGDVITRNGYETYQFCNQNLEVINLPPLASPATYAAIDIPDITIESSNVDEFIIKGTNLNSDYTYALFAQLHSSVGASSLTPKPLLVGLISYADLLAGIDVVPYFDGVLEIPAQTYRAAILVSAIDQITGNRDIDGVKLDANVDPNPPVPSIVYSSYFDVSNYPINQGSFNADGTAIFNTFHTGGRNIKRYDLSSPYNLSTAVYASQKNVTPSSPRGSVITPDGLNVYTFNSSANAIYQGLFTTPFDFTTYSHVRSKAITIRDCQFSLDGLKMLAFNAYSVSYYTLTTPFDVSTLVLQSTKSYGFYAGAFCANPNGSQFFVMRTNRRLYTFTMSTPFDVSTAVLEPGYLSFAAIIGSFNFSGLAFSYDGYYVLWTQYNTNPRFKMFTLSVPWTFPDSF